MPQAQPELKKVCNSMGPFTYPNQQILQYMEKRLFVQLNGNRKVIGILRGYDVCTVYLPNLQSPGLANRREGLPERGPRRGGRRESWW